MPATEQELYAFFAAHNIRYSTFEHRPLFTVADGEEVWPNLPGLHCKNLFLKDHKDKLWLVVMPGAMRADLKALAATIGAGKLSFGKPDLLQAVLGIAPGSVTPFALLNDIARQVTVVLDETMLQSEQVNYHPLRNDKSTTITSADLKKFVTALGYRPLIVACGAEAAAA